MPPFKAILFDCDNTLVLSEALAFEACADLTNDLLKKHGVKETYTAADLLAIFVGQNFRGMVNGLQKKHNFQMEEEEVQEWVDKELGLVVKKLDEKAEACANCIPEVKKVYDEGKYKLAIVSTSALSRVLASIRKVGLDQYFAEDHVFSAATSLDPPSSKPDPTIYHHACKAIGVNEKDCVTIEDSKSGATAAKNAGVPLIGYVGPYYVEGMEMVKAKEKMLKEECGALVVMHDWKEFPQCLQAAIDS